MFKLVDSDIIAMIDTRWEINPNIIRVGMILDWISKKMANGVEDLGNNHVLYLVPLNVFGCDKVGGFEGVINKNNFVFGIESSLSWLFAILGTSSR